MYSAYKLNKQCDNIQPWCTPCSSEPVCCSMSSSNCCFLYCYRFLRRHGGCSGIPVSKNFSQFVVIYTVKGFSIVSEAEVFFKVCACMELSCFLYDAVDIGNLVLSSSANLSMWKFSVYLLLKPSLENIEHYFASMWNECSCTVVWTFFALLSLGLVWKLIFSSPVTTAESEFAGILSATLPQHHLLGFEIA